MVAPTIGAVNLIVDVHTHIYHPDIVKNWRGIAEREKLFGVLASGVVHKWAAGEDVLSAMDEDGVGESFVCGFAFSDLALCRESNDYVLDCAARSGGRLRPVIAVPPLARGAAGEIERCAELGAIGVGELQPEGQDFDISRIEETWRLAAVCHERGLFVMIHTAEPIGRGYPGKGGVGPIEAYRFAVNHPELRVVFAHWGGGLFFYEQMSGVKTALKNVWYDTAAAPFVYNPSIFGSAVASGAGEKLLYGSDFPLLRYPRYKKMIEAGLLTTDEFEKITSANVERLLHSGG
ncbi:hypothetical protein FACS1894167_07530 [Synergistales bacterium]|nr:hypothetical protein FACS1894167_07530 [Synergistales bacterium]